MTKYHKQGKSSYSIPRKKSGQPGSHRRSYPGITVAGEVFESRSERAKTMDLLKMAEIAPNVTAWLQCPNRLDLLGLDTPDAALVFSHRSKRSQAQDLARAARRKVPVEVWIADPSKVDLKRIDTPSSKKPKPRRFKVVEKEEGKKLELKKAESKKVEEEKQGRHLPTSEEITERAVELFQEKQAKAGLSSITPEKNELAESGLFEIARQDLMRTGSKVDSQVLEYVHNLNSELEPMGFRVVEID